MVWQQWVLVALLALNVVLTIALVGQPRKPITPGTAAFGLVFNAALVWMVVSI